jgi:hypothetical protein
MTLIVESRQHWVDLDEGCLGSRTVRLDPRRAFGAVIQAGKAPVSGERGPIEGVLPRG